MKKCSHAEESIEFQVINDEISSQTLARRYFRIPITDKSEFSLIIGEKIYSIVNISINGMGIFVAPDDNIYLGQVLNNCEPIISGQKITGLKGKIIHCSRNISEQRMCGIQWIELTSDNRNKIKSILINLQKQYLKQNQSEI